MPSLDDPSSYYAEKFGKLTYSDALSEILNKIAQTKADEIEILKSTTPASPLRQTAPVAKLVENRVEKLVENRVEEMDAPIAAPKPNPLPEEPIGNNYDEIRGQMEPLGGAPKNPRFVFHNKIPKAGSTTMKWLLVALSKRNGFTLDHAR
mgnify:CR=1 FL=1